jgi:GDP-4-dehydro-6-deoxy-D-mannose reductase
VRALVTGGSGFVGTWLTRHLRAQGDAVIAVDHEVDVTDAASVRDVVIGSEPDAVYHLAALTHVGKSWEDPAEVLRVNALGTLNVLEAARAGARPVRVLITSSAEVYGNVTEDDLPLTEHSRLAPVTPYGVSKLAAEFLGLQAYLAHGLEVISVRAFNHVGPGQSTDFVISSIASHIVEAQRSGGHEVPVGNLSPRRDLTDVRDVVRAYRLVVEKGAPGEVYNVCSGRDHSIAEVAAKLLELAGAELELAVDDSRVRPVDTPVLRGDPQKMNAATGWRPEIPLSKTLRDVLDELVS